jgi:hypothetical protein
MDSYYMSVVSVLVVVVVLSDWLFANVAKALGSSFMWQFKERFKSSWQLIIGMLLMFGYFHLQKIQALPEWQLVCLGAAGAAIFVFKPIIWHVMKQSRKAGVASVSDEE